MVLVVVVEERVVVVVASLMVLRENAFHSAPYTESLSDEPLPLQLFQNRTLVCGIFQI